MGIADPDLCVELANGQVRAAHALRDDLLAVLFPHAGVLPSELLQSRVRIKLKALTTAIECSLLGADDDTEISWPRLSETGLLRENALIDFALARIYEEELNIHLAQADNAAPLGELPVILLSHTNERIAEMARALLFSAQTHANKVQILHHRLSGELLHLLTWRVAAALIEADAKPAEEITAAVQHLFGQHDSRFDPMAIARKLYFFLGSEHRTAVKDPRISGLQLFIAALSKEYDLADDFILRMIGTQQCAALLLLLKGQELPLDTALPIVTALKGSAVLADMPFIESQYNALDSIEARAAVLSWCEIS